MVENYFTVNGKHSRTHRARLKRAVVEALEYRSLLSTSVLTYHNDTNNGGANSTEVQLTPTNVKTGSFGKLFATNLDGQVYAQPLVDSGVTIAGGVHNVVFAATEGDSLYAIDSATGGVLWHRSFLTISNSNGILNNTLNATSIATVSTADVNSGDVSPSIGITSTPVIDSARNLIYLVTKTKEVIGGTATFVQRLHAINIADGTDATAPFLIGQTTGNNTNTTSMWVYGGGDGYVLNSSNQKIVQFNALRDNQRAALSLVNNTVYVAWASHGDNGPYHGWVAAWSVANLTTSGFALTGVLNTSPNDGEAGIWSSGGGLVWEPDGSAFYFLTGNGTGGAPTDGSNGLPIDADYNEALVKAQPDPTTSPANQNANGWGLKIVQSFTPYNVAALDGADSDFGSGAPILIPTPITINGVATNVIVVGGKDGRLFVLNRNKLGGYNPKDDAALNSVPNGNGDDTPPVADAGTLSSPAWYNGNLYVVSGYNGSAYEFAIGSTGALTTVSQTGINFGYEPGSPSVSANGTNNGIVWIPDRNTNELHAYAANSLNNELWNSAQAGGGADSPGAVEKFANPTVANGEVFVGTTSQLVAYGLTPAATSASKAPVLAVNVLSGSAVNLTWTDSSVAPNLATAYLIQESTDGNNYTQVTTAPAGAASIGIGGLNASTKYYFRIQGYNNIGASAFSNVANATTSSQSAGINFSGGFASAGASLTRSAAINGSNLQLTDGNLNETSSAFSSTAQDITHFTSQFTFQISAGANTADGLTFAIQNSGPSALGGIAGSLGYAGINNSVAIKFDLYNNSGEGVDSTGLFSNGSIPTNTGSIDLSSTGINLHSGDPIQVNLTYDGSTLTVVLKDTTSGATATQTYGGPGVAALNIPAIVGSGTAYVGFTGASGGLGAVQNIQNWTYTPSSGASPNAPTGLGATPATATSVTLNWSNNALNVTGYHLDRAADAGFTQSLITETLPAGSTTYTDTAAGLATNQTFYYRIRAFNSVGDSGNSNAASVTIPVSPAKASNQQVTGVSTSEIDMSWQDNAGHSALGYHVLRATNQGTFVLVATLPPTSRTAPSTYNWADTTVTPGSYYEYHIQAYNSSGYNDFAGVNATALTLPPTGVSAVSGSNSVTVSWSPVTVSGNVSYNVYRGTSAGGESSTPITRVTSGTSYVDALPPTGTVYYYKVTAVNANGSDTPPLPSESALSGEASTSGVTSGGKLSGTVIGTPGSYDSLSSDAASAAFDGNLSTFFDAPTASGSGTGTYASNWVGLDLGSAYNITSIAYAPRVASGGIAYEARMIGGIFQASNTADFSSGVVTLYTVNTQPADALTTQTVSASGYRYVRYLAPANSYGNVAEVQFFGALAPGATPTVTSGPTAAVSSTGITAALAVSASEAGNPALTYTWSAPTLPDGVSAGPTFSSTNGTTGGNAVTATFRAAGTYGLNVTITDPSKNSIVVPLTVNVGQVLTSIKIYPTSVPVLVPAGGTKAFTAVGNDQFTDVLDTNPTFTWSVASGGIGSIISATGVFTASTTVGTTGTVTASAVGTAGTVVGSQPVKVIAASAGTSVALTGTVIGTPGSYDGLSSDSGNAAFDGNQSTFFDAPTASGSGSGEYASNWVGLDLGSAYNITSLAYAPRVTSGGYPYEARMTGGIFQASNDPTFSTGVVNLYTVTGTPADGLTTQTVSATGSYRYVRYLAPANSYGNEAEVQFFGTPAVSAPGTPTLTSSTSSTATISWTASTSTGVTGYIVLRNNLQAGTTNGTTFTYPDSGLSASTTYSYTVETVVGTTTSAPSGALSVTTPAAAATGQLTGTVIGTTGSYDGLSTDAAGAAFDGNTGTFFDAPTASGSGSGEYASNWVGLDLGSAYNITSITYAPRAGSGGMAYESRMVGGIFQASNTADFSSGVVNLYTVTSQPADGFTSQSISVTGGYRYIRYLAPGGSYGNIADMQVFGTPAGPSQLSGTVIGTTGSYDGLSADAAGAAFDGNLNTSFDAPTANGAWVGLDLGTARTITSVTYAPRASSGGVAYETRMLGGVFQASNTADFSSGVVYLYTITSTPADGYTTQAVNAPGTYRYVRYLAPGNSYDNIAELQFGGF